MLSYLFQTVDYELRLLNPVLHLLGFILCIFYAADNQFE